MARAVGDAEAQGPMSLLGCSLAALGWGINADLELVTMDGRSLHLVDPPLQELQASKTDRVKYSEHFTGPWFSALPPRRQIASSILNT